jgi:hypothetical protein
MNALRIALERLGCGVGVGVARGHLALLRRCRKSLRGQQQTHNKGACRIFIAISAAVAMPGGTGCNEV